MERLENGDRCALLPRRPLTLTEAVTAVGFGEVLSSEELLAIELSDASAYEQAYKQSFQAARPAAIEAGLGDQWLERYGSNSLLSCAAPKPVRMHFEFVEQHERDRANKKQRRIAAVGALVRAAQEGKIELLGYSDESPSLVPIGREQLLHFSYLEGLSDRDSMLFQRSNGYCSQYHNVVLPEEAFRSWYIGPSVHCAAGNDVLPDCPVLKKAPEAKIRDAIGKVTSLALRQGVKVPNVKEMQAPVLELLTRNGWTAPKSRITEIAGELQFQETRLRQGQRANAAGLRPSGDLDLSALM